MVSESGASRGDQVRPGVEFARILVATDFSAIAGHALDYARVLCRQFHAKLFLVHIVPEEFHFVPPESIHETVATAKNYAQKELQELVRRAGLDDVVHEEILGQGQVWPTLQDILRSEQIDLMVIGTHGRASKKKLTLGGIAEEIFRSADCPVLTVGPQAKISEGVAVAFRNLLYPTNFKPHSERASSAAYYLEREHAAHLSVLHVVEEAGDGTRKGNEILREFLTKRMRKTMPAERLNNCEPDFLVRFGEASEEILNAAAESKANLIVLGLRPAEKSAGRLPSAVAYRVVWQAPCPVLTLRR